MTDAGAARNGGRRQPTDVPLPQLAHLPDLPHSELDTEHERRERHLARNRTRLQERKAWRDAIAKYHDERPPFIEPAVIVVTFTVDARGVNALVEWCAGRVGSRRVLRRLGGPLRVDQRSVRGLGPTVGLLRLLRAVTEEFDQ